MNVNYISIFFCCIAFATTSLESQGSDCFDSEAVLSITQRFDGTDLSRVLRYLRGADEQTHLEIGDRPQALELSLRLLELRPRRGQPACEAVGGIQRKRLVRLVGDVLSQMAHSGYRHFAERTQFLRVSYDCQVHLHSYLDRLYRVLLEDVSPDVRAEMAVQLRRAGDLRTRAVGVHAIVPLLASVARDPDSDVRTTAAGQIIIIVSDALRNQRYEPEYHLSFIQAASVIKKYFYDSSKGSSREYLRQIFERHLLLDTLTDYESGYPADNRSALFGSSEERLAAFGRLGKRGSIDGFIPVLAALLFDKDEGVRESTGRIFRIADFEPDYERRVPYEFLNSPRLGLYIAPRTSVHAFRSIVFDSRETQRIRFVALGGAHSLHQQIGYSDFDKIEDREIRREADRLILERRRTSRWE